MRNPMAAVSDPNTFFTNPGDSIRLLYDAKVAENGTINVVQTGKEDYQAYIESFRSQTDFSYILKQIALGNTSVLNQSPAQYGDFTNMPKSLSEALQMDIDAEKAFLKLPLDIRQTFNNNYREWLYSIGTDTWSDRMGIQKEKPIDPVSDDNSNEKGEPVVNG